MKCPVCKDVNLVMADRQGIEIDYCPECRGVWLDRGELDKIIERSATQPSPPREREAYHDRSRSHDKRDYRYKKKKSLWGNCSISKCEFVKSSGARGTCKTLAGKPIGAGTDRGPIAFYPDCGLAEKPLKESLAVFK